MREHRPVQVYEMMARLGIEPKACFKVPHVVVALNASADYLDLCRSERNHSKKINDSPAIKYDRNAGESQWQAGTLRSPHL